MLTNSWLVEKMVGDQTLLRITITGLEEIDFKSMILSVRYKPLSLSLSIYDTHNQRFLFVSDDDF